jgi:hypothetical protein
MSLLTRVLQLKQQNAISVRMFVPSFQNLTNLLGRRTNFLPLRLAFYFVRIASGNDRSALA